MFYRIFFTPTLAFALAFVGVFSVLFTPLDAGAQLPGEDSHIQLQFVMVPAKNARGLTESRAITSIYTVKYAEDVPTFCQKAPRVRETLIAFFNKYPLTIGPDRRLQLEGVGAKLVPHINRSMGKVMVTEAILLEGSKRLAKGAMSRLPFATTQGCGRVLEEYEQRMKELLNAREK